MTLPDNEAQVLDAFISAAEDDITSEPRMNAERAPVYTSHEMVQDELTFPILCDLGTAKLGKPPHEGLVQALPYRAPEVMLGASWDSKIDIWGLGVLVSLPSFLLPMRRPIVEFHLCILDLGTCSWGTTFWRTISKGLARTDVALSGSST